MDLEVNTHVSIASMMEINLLNHDPVTKLSLSFPNPPAMRK